jgi:ppGpp synthetase/RelA/SpoT-type nucleotidyltranferase
LQVVVIATLGGVVSLLAQEFNRDREKREALNDFRKTLLSHLVQIFREAKKARRLLRAKRDSLQFYDEQMAVINELQLDLETINEEIKTTKQAFPGEEAQSRISTMATYLNKLVEEYEKNMPKLNRKSPSVSLDQLEYLNDFIGPFRESKFSKEFAHLYNEALKLMRDVIMGSK